MSCGNCGQIHPVGAKCIYPNFTPWDDSPRGLGRSSVIWIDCACLDSAGNRCILIEGHSGPCLINKKLHHRKVA